MAVGRSKRLLAVAGAVGCLGLLGGPGYAVAEPGRAPVAEQGPTGSGDQGTTPPANTAPESGPVGPLAIPGRQPNVGAEANQEAVPPLGAVPVPGLGTGSAAPAPANIPPASPATPGGTDTGSSGPDSGDVAQWEPLNIPGRSSAADTGQPVEPAAPAAPVQVAEPVGPVGLGTALGTILATGSAAPPAWAPV
jgi:hypothetical protein